MVQTARVVTLTRETLPVFLSIFGDLSVASTYRGSRSLLRRPSRCPIEYLRTRASGDAEMLAAECVDISEAGIGFTCQDALEVGATIEIFLPGESQEYAARVKIVHANEKGGVYRCGGKFIWDR